MRHLIEGQGLNIWIGLIRKTKSRGGRVNMIYFDNLLMSWGIQILVIGLLSGMGYMFYKTLH
jgi:hypothetical protein